MNALHLVSRFHRRLSVRDRFRRPYRLQRSWALRVETVEDRTVPSTWTVTTNADSGNGSLRAAIAGATSGDQIVFDHGLAGQTITLTTGELVITQDLDIEGLGAEQLAISGNHASRIFDISGGATITLAGLTLTAGLALQVGAAGQGGAIINLQIATGHAPKFTRAASAMAFTIRFDAKTPRRLLELVIMRTAEIVGSTYEINQHIPLAKMCGYSDAQIAALPTWQASTLFESKERAALAYVEEITRGGDVDDPTFAALQKFSTPQEIVEITYTVGSYYANGLLTKALRIEVEHDGRETVPGKC